MAIARHWWTASAGLILVCGAAAFVFPRGRGLAVFGDISQLALMLFATLVMLANAVSSRRQTRTFWGLMAAGCFLWSLSQASWTYYEVILRRDLPEPCISDIVLFIHIVPFIAAVALRPHRPEKEQKLHFTTLNFLMLLIWWVFLYAFIVFPDEYVILNSRVYSRNYDLLYMTEGLVLAIALATLAASTKNSWRKIYWNLFIASAAYTLTSELLNAAQARGMYYTGSWYDVPFDASICWLIWAGLQARLLQPASETTPHREGKWLALTPRLAMVSIISLPLVGLWSQFFDTSHPAIRYFRLLATLAAMLVLGLFLFLRQYLLDRELIRLLEESQQSLENLERLQTQLIQKEKLASLGQLVAGAANEINYPIGAILDYAGSLAVCNDLEPSQIGMAQKIAQHARRTRDLLSDLLSFARQTPAEKTQVDVGALVQRAVHMEMLHLESRKIRVEIHIAPGLPPVWGNSNQLFQCCLEIIGNAKDALEDHIAGTLSVHARCENDEVVLEFSDSGPGIREPQRVFDPFYTTKSIGKGTGLGLSATYGVVQDHGGQITCFNRTEGGAAFVLRFPAARTQAPLAAEAAKA